MGFHTMGSQNHFLPLSRQTSYYSLTLDEVQNHLDGGLAGKPLGSMNLDDLLKNLCPTTTATTTPSSAALHHQPSFTNKTVDEVWRDIQQAQTTTTSQQQHIKTHQTLGEMTLEDFLVKAGIVSAEITTKPPPPPPPPAAAAAAALPSDLITSTAQTHWMHYPLPPVQHHQNVIGGFMHPVPHSLSMLPMDAASPDNHMAISSPLMSDTQTPRRKRAASGDIIQKTVERRQKRMIKNRESAARSRARKQAYTNELENKVSRLEEENARLKEQRKKELLLPYVPPPPEPVVQLRRTSSAGF